MLPFCQTRLEAFLRPGTDADFLPGIKGYGDVDMILQILANARKIMGRLDPDGG